MIYISAYREEGRFHCSLTNGRLSVDCVGGSFPATLTRAVLKLTVRQVCAVFVKERPGVGTSQLIQDSESDTKDA